MEISDLPARANGAEIQSAEKPKRQRQPRNSACQGCQAQKMKCVAGPVPGICERCHRTGRECVPPVPKSRKRTSSALDTDNDPLMPYYGEAQHQDAQDRRPSAPTKFETAQQPSNESLTQLLADGLGIDANAQNILRGVDHEFVRTSLNIFESMLAHFPFVTLAPNPDPYRMINERPFTTLAICVIASPARPNVQQRLAQCFRQALSQKAVVQGDRNLDLLLGLLTYLAWPHHFATTHRVYPLLHLLAGIAADLGYYEQSPMSNTINVADGARERAFVGCFHLCCGLSIVGFTRPSPLRWADNLGHWAQSLTSMGTQSTDRQLAGIVDLSRALQDFDEILRTAAGARLATSAGLIELQAKSALQRLRALRSTYPVLGGALAFSAMSLHVYRRVLQFNPTPDTATLFQCACSVKEYLDDVLARPPILMHRLATVEWTHLLEILMLMAKISNSASDAGGWEAGALTSMLQPEAILDSLCAHMSKAPTDDPLAPRQDSQLHWLGSVCENIKQRLLRQPINGLANGGVGGHGFRPVNDPYQSRLPAQQDYRAAAHGKHDRSDVLANGVWAEPLVTELSST